MLALASDAALARASQGLAVPRRWRGPGQEGDLVWGEISGSAAEPYRVAVQLEEAVFKCSCPSRKLPCKHGLGLLLLRCEHPSSFVAGAPPDWVGAWLLARAAGARRQAKRRGGEVPSSEDDSRRAARAARRESRVVKGVEELGKWLRDQLRHGLSSFLSSPGLQLESLAARLVDAQAPGLGGLLRGLDASGLPAGERAERVLERLTRIHLLVEACRHLDTLPPELEADVRARIGWTVTSEDVLAGEGHRSQWLVLGRAFEEEAQLRTARTWLWSPELERPGLVLSHAAPGQQLDLSLEIGTAIEAVLCFYPGTVPLRALVRERSGAAREVATPTGLEVREAVRRAGEALALCPLLERYPILLGEVVPLRRPDGLWVRGAGGEALKITRAFQGEWELLAVSGGRPITLFAEWRERELSPLTVWGPEGLVRLADGTPPAARERVRA